MVQKAGMIQRIAVRIVLEHKGKVLLLRRSDGRESILGYYELPGGRLLADEQPEDALRRHLGEAIGETDAIDAVVSNVFTYTDADDRDIQYAIVLYHAVFDRTKRAINLGRHYDKYVWYQPGKLPLEQLTGLTLSALGLSNAQPVVSTVSQGVSMPVVYTDGGSRGNPGPSAAGYVLVDEQGEVVDQGGEYLGITTNNQAEYQGVRLGLEAALARGWQTIEVRVDSMLVVHQLNGVYKIKNRELWPVHELIRELIPQFDKVKFVHVPREMNRLADGMVNKVLDDSKKRADIV